jgi:hypothetical protein
MEIPKKCTADTTCSRVNLIQGLQDPGDDFFKGWGLRICLERHSEGLHQAISVLVDKDGGAGVSFDHL